MSHEIFGERFIGRRQPAWHGLGQVFPQDETLSLPDAVTRSKCDYTVEKIPLTILGPDETRIEVANQCVIMRKPTEDDTEWRYFGHASTSYGLLQNSEIAETMQSLNEQWPVETMGALHNGKTFFFTMKMPTLDVKGEAIDQYLLFADQKDGGTKAKMAITPVRVVCQNTLTAGLNSAVVTAQMQHHKTIKSELEFRTELIKRVQRAQGDVMAAFTKLAETQVSEDMVADMFAAAHPYPKKNVKVLLAEDSLSPEDIAELGDLYAQAQTATASYAYHCSRADAFRADCQTLFAKVNDEFPAIAGTAWAAWNAVVECADFRPAQNDVVADYHALFGGRLKEKVRAFDKAMEFVVR